MSLEIAASVMESYTQIDGQIAAFQADTQIQCPSGCGACCESPDVETTPLEVLPLVLELHRQGMLETWLDRAETGDRPCVFYAPNPFIEGNGRCQVYTWRPTICRLFGFSTTTDKAGEPKLAACVRHKQAIPEIVAQAQGAIAQGLTHPPNLATATQAVLSIDPGLSQRRLPINEAFRVAAERVGLWLQMSAAEDPPTPLTPPPAPQGPKAA